MQTSTEVPIARIVATSLAAGFFAALLLALIPFGGAAENQINGAALIGFGAGWALLALRARRVKNLQRCAAIAAITCMTSAAVLFVWPRAVVMSPLFLFIFAIWIAVVTRPRTWLIFAACAVMLAAGLGGVYEAGRESTDQTPMRGQLVDIGGRRLHLRCTGSGFPTAVLVPGAGEFSAVWGWIEPQVAKGTRVCVYDRAGRAWSDDAPVAQAALTIAADLHALLSHAGEAGPYLLVGHSFGGLSVLNFAARYPEEVAGVVLLDSTSPEQFTALPQYPKVWDAYRRVSALFPSLARLGIGRIAYRTSFDALPQESRDEQLAFWPTPRMARSQLEEWSTAPVAMRQARALKSLGDRPLIVITARREAIDGWLPLQAKLTRLSTHGVQRVLQDATHESIVGNRADSARSVEAIRDVVLEVRKNREDKPCSLQRTLT